MDVGTVLFLFFFKRSTQILVLVSSWSIVESVSVYYMQWRVFLCTIGEQWRVFLCIIGEQWRVFLCIIGGQWTVESVSVYYR